MQPMSPERRKTPLLIACEENKEESKRDIVRLLLSAGADTNRRDHLGRTALHYAAEKGDIDILNDLMLDPKTNILAKDGCRNTPFDLAACYDDRAAINDRLLELYGSKMTEQEGRLAFHAILGPAEYLFQFGEPFHPPLNPLKVKVSLPLGYMTLEHFGTLLHSLDTELLRNRDDSGKLPIHIACQANAPVEVLSMLVERDPATLQIADYTGSLPIHCLLLSCSDKCSPIEDASVHYLVKQGGVGTLAARDREGALPLHTYLRGSTFPSLRIVQYLIQSFPGALTAWTTNDGLCPFMMAACKTSSASQSVVYELVRANPALVVPK